jgi:hypothetical protein
MASSGQPEGVKDRNKIVIIFVAVALLILFAYVLFTSGQAGVMDLIKTFLKWAAVLAVFGLIVFAVMKFLQKTPVDLVENDRQDIIEAGRLSKPPMVKDLYFTGDKEHGEFRVGSIVGYCQLMSYKDIDIIAGLTPQQIEQMEREGKIPSDYIIKEDCFIFKTSPWPFSLFEQPKVLRTLENEHSQLIGDVKVYGVSMVKKYSFYYPNRAHLDITRIDIAVIREAWRGGLHQFLKDFVSITQNAVGLDAEYKKELDRRKLLKIPTPLGNDEEMRPR